MPCPWIGRLTIGKMSVLPKEIYIFTSIPIKILMAFLTKIEKLVPIFMELKGALSSQNNTGKEKQSCRTPTS